MTTTALKPEIGVEITGVHGHDFVDAGIAADCLMHRIALLGTKSVA